MRIKSKNLRQGRNSTSWGRRIIKVSVITSQCRGPEHLLDRGFRHFAYFSLLGVTYVSSHQQAFIRTVGQAGCDCAVHAIKPRTGAEPNWRIDLARLVEWLKALPKPVAILTWNASSGRELIPAALS